MLQHVLRKWIVYLTERLMIMVILVSPLIMFAISVTTVVVQWVLVAEKERIERLVLRFGTHQLSPLVVDGLEPFLDRHFDGSHSEAIMSVAQKTLVGFGTVRLVSLLRTFSLVVAAARAGSVDILIEVTVGATMMA